MKELKGFFRLGSIVALLGLTTIMPACSLLDDDDDDCDPSNEVYETASDACG